MTASPHLLRDEEHGENHRLGVTAAFVAMAEVALSDLANAQQIHVNALAEKLDSDLRKVGEKEAGIRRVMEAKGLKRTPAEEQVETDEEYAAFLREHHRCQQTELASKYRADVARLRAELAVRRVA